MPAQFIKTRAMDQLRATAKAIAREVERQRAEMPAAVARETKA